MISQQTGWPEWLTTWDNLGSHYPYYQAGQNAFYMKISSALGEISLEQRRIDPVAIIEILSKGYILGKRTLISGLWRSPWMGCPDGHGGWKYADVPQHGNAKLPADDVAAQLKEQLCREALDYLTGKNCAGILLSGGLDSRIVAGIVRDLQLSGEFAGNVVALTWGLGCSRDVIYAQEIAKRFGWECLHFPLEPEVLAQNIFIAGEMGAEFSPLHLHAMSQIRELNGIDVILAGSYGDSVGRAEYSGRSVLRLKPTIPRFLNRFGLIKDDIVRASHDLVVQDAYGYREYLQRDAVYQYRELEQEMHYMRRMLQACMTCIAQRIPLFQLFTAPESFALMWGIDSSIRDNRFYEALLPTLPGGIGSLPWARTGLPLGAIKGHPDEAPQLFHKYGLWLRRDLRGMVTQLVTSDTIKELNLFNEQALNSLMKLWPKAQTTTTNSIDEIISWIASLAVFAERYKLQPIDAVSTSWRDTANLLLGGARAWCYQTARGRFRQ
jgi:asparagine synthase (glutamine-hydrolysing)